MEINGSHFLAMTQTKSLGEPTERTRAVISLLNVGIERTRTGTERTHAVFHPLSPLRRLYLFDVWIADVHDEYKQVGGK